MAIEKRIGAVGKPAYRVRIAQRDPLTGKRQNLTIGTYPTKAAAQKAEREAMTQRDKGTLLRPDTTTVSDVLADWLRVKADTVSSNTLADYSSSARLHIIPALGGVRVQALRPDVVQRQYATWREAGMSARLVRLHHLVLSQALDQAVRFGIISANPCRSVVPPRIEQRHRDVWDAQQVTIFMEAAKDDRLWPLWPLLVIEGLRRGEALGLRWADIDLGRGVVHITQTVVADKSDRGAAVVQRRTKTHAGARSVRLSAFTVAALRDHRKAHLARRLAATEWLELDLVICTGRGTPVSPRNVQRSFDAIVKCTGLPRIRVHDLRHSSATIALSAGVPLRVVSERLGHSGIAVTADVYGHVTTEMQDDAVHKLDAVFPVKEA